MTVFAYIWYYYEACPKNKVPIIIKNRKSALLINFLHGHFVLFIHYLYYNINIL
jgi:hypothetical protein